ncbi:hypothetical protein CLOP_g15737 [Closterium sp. NIES-67]|nr:hypothetical protein CLOP_g15737 [Closterium sp. NIES-67]
MSSGDASSALTKPPKAKHPLGGRRVELSYPIHNGVVQRWDDMGHVWDYTSTPLLASTPRRARSCSRTRH